MDKDERIGGWNAGGIAVWLRNKIIEAELVEPDDQEEARVLQGRIQAFTEVLEKLGAPVALDLSATDGWHPNGWLAERLARQAAWETMADLGSAGSGSTGYLIPPTRSE